MREAAVAGECGSVMAGIIRSHEPGGQVEVDGWGRHASECCVLPI